MTDYLSDNSTELTDEQRSAVRSVLSSVPVAGLPHGGMGIGINPATDVQVLEIIEYLGKALGRALRENEALREDKRQYEADMQAFRRVIGTAS